MSHFVMISHQFQLVNFASADTTLPPLQGGSWRGIGDRTVQAKPQHPIPTPALPLKRREISLGSAQHHVHIHRGIGISEVMQNGM